MKNLTLKLTVSTAIVLMTLPLANANTQAIGVFSADITQVCGIEMPTNTADIGFNNTTTGNSIQLTAYDNFVSGAVVIGAAVSYNALLADKFTADSLVADDQVYFTFTGPGVDDSDYQSASDMEFGFNVIQNQPVNLEVTIPYSPTDFTEGSVNITTTFTITCA